jgi:hypothetical protein
MYRQSILICCFALALAACGSTHHRQKVQQPAAAEPSAYVVQIEQPAATELRADVGATMLKVAKIADRRPTISTELKYLGLAEGGRIKLRVLSTDSDTNKNLRRRLGREGNTNSTPDAFDFEQNQAEAFTIEGFEVELIEAQASWIRYRINLAGEAHNTPLHQTIPRHATRPRR